jgi:hypothetical protein
MTRSDTYMMTVLLFIIFYRLLHSLHSQCRGQRPMTQVSLLWEPQLLCQIWRGTDRMVRDSNVEMPG